MQGVRRAVRGFGWLLLAACSPKPATAVVVAISADADVPAELDRVQVTVVRGGATTFTREYDLRSERAVPGTLTLVDESESGEPISVEVRGRRPSDADYRLSRRARLTMPERETKLLRLRLQMSCYDVVCGSGATCIDGACARDDVDAATLPDYSTPEEALAPSGCFDEAKCLSTLERIGVTKCEATVSQSAGTYNLAATWRAAPSHAVVVEPVGYTVNGSSVKLSYELCSAMAQGDLLSLFVASSCATKSPSSPVCEVLPGSTSSAGAGGGGHGGTSGAGGAAGKSGSANAGAGGGGTAGVGGAGAGGAGNGGAGAAGAGMGGAGMGGAGMGGAGMGGAGMGGAGMSGMGGAGAGGAGGGTLSPLSSPLAVGVWGTCGLHGGDVACWGYNGHFGGLLLGQSRPDTFFGAPVKVSGLIAPTAVFTGEATVCAIHDNGKLACWGNPGDALGPGSTGDVKNIALPDVVLGAGTGPSTCAWLANGEVWCWGGGDGGRGDGTLSSNPTPTLALTGAESFDGHCNAKCAIKAGDAWCWGAGVTTPTKLDIGGAKATKVTSWTGAPYVLSDTAVMRFAPNGASNWTQDFTYPLTGISAASVDALSAGDYQVLVASGGSVYQLGDVAPTKLNLPPGVTHVSAGQSYAYQRLACARYANEDARCWGRNWVGELGDDKQDAVRTALKVWNGPTVDLSLSENVSLAIGTDKKVTTWGEAGALTHNTPDLVPRTLAVTGADNAYVWLGAVSAYGYVKKTDGTIEPWLDGAKRVDTTSLDSYAPKMKMARPGAVLDLGVDLSGNAVVKLRSPDASMLGTGLSGVAGDVSTPLSGVIEVTGRLGDYGGEAAWACARTAMDIKCWGYNDYGQLGVGDTLGRATPTAVLLSSTSLTSLTSGEQFSCVLDANTGEVWCWGHGDQGQMGAGTADRPIPVQVPIGGGYAGVSAAHATACAWKSAGAITCWGNNEWSTVGAGTRSFSLPPSTWTLPGGVGATLVSMGRRHGCAIGTDTKVYCWGNSTFGQVGDGRTGVLPAPGVVVAWP